MQDPGHPDSGQLQLARAELAHRRGAARSRTGRVPEEGQVFGISMTTRRASSLQVSPAVLPGFVVTTEL